ncbi:MAG TPA: substrate-binding domain-containing protein, partial [Polyangia bacterium]|nr:substrate-binding domain-containing protein [Polyangia bacterium]
HRMRETIAAIASKETIAMKRSLHVIVLLIVAAVLVFAGSGCKKGGSKPTIAVIPKGMTHSFWISVREGAEKAGRELGYEIAWQGPVRERDVEAQVQIVEDFVQQGVKGVVLAPVDDGGLVPKVEQLAEKKIPCVIIDSGVKSDKYVSFVATDNYEGGRIAARRMGKILNGKGRVMVVKYQPNSDSTTARENGFIETIEKEFPGIKIAAAEYGEDTVETALARVEDMLTANPDLQGLFACNQSTSLGALQALKSCKRSEVKMIGFDADRALVGALQAGQIDSLVIQNPYKMGYEGVRTLVAHIRGQQVPRNIDTGAKLVTMESLNDPEVKEALDPQLR